MKMLRSILPVLFLATSAFAQDVSYNFDSNADFSKYKTYRWEKHPQSVDLDEITLTKLGAAFDAELAKKGLVKTTETPDLVIVYQAALMQEKEVNSYSSGWNDGGGYGWYTGGSYGSTMAMTTSTTSTISIGSLDLDMYDAAKQKLIWRGIVSKTLDPKAKPDKQAKNMAKAAEKLMKNYPPPIKK